MDKSDATIIIGLQEGLEKAKEDFKNFKGEENDQNNQS
jgi:hypothetical protein